MSERFPSPSERRGWHLRAASSPEKPVALGAHSARAMLALLAEGGHIEAHDALAAALAGGNVDAIRVQMDRARAVLPPQPSSREQREAELAAAVERVREEACVAAVVERRVAPQPSPVEIRARLAAALESGVPDDLRADIERTHGALVAAIEARRVPLANAISRHGRALLERVSAALPAECA